MIKPKDLLKESKKEPKTEIIWKSGWGSYKLLLLTQTAIQLTLETLSIPATQLIPETQWTLQTQETLGTPETKEDPETPETQDHDDKKTFIYLKISYFY